MSDPVEPIDPDHIIDWPIGRNKIESPAHVHAFGMIALNASMLEESLFLLLLTYLPIQRESATRLIGDMNNRDRSDWFRALIETNEKTPDMADRMIHAILCFDICIDNRNMLIHALHAGTDKLTATMRLTKRARSNPLREIRFEVSIAALRKIADEIGSTLNYMLDWWFHKTNPLDPPRPLPEKPPRPDRLTIPQP